MSARNGIVDGATPFGSAANRMLVVFLISISVVIGVTLILLLYFGRFEPWVLMLTAVVAASTFGAGFLCCRRVGQLISEQHEVDLGDCQKRIEEMQRHYGISGLDSLCSQVIPVWAGQITMARTHMESETNALTQRFGDISLRLNESISRLDATSNSGHGDSLIVLLQRTQQELFAIVSGLKQTLDNKVALLDDDGTPL